MESKPRRGFDLRDTAYRMKLTLQFRGSWCNQAILAVVVCEYSPTLSPSTIRTSDVMTVVGCVLLKSKVISKLLLTPYYVVISEVNCVFLKRRRMLEISPPM